MLTVSAILGTILDNASDLYLQRVEEYNGENLVQLGKAITSDKNIMNEFIESLINKVAFSNVKSKMYNNPLKRLKSAGIPMGNTIEEIFVNPATDVGYQSDGALLLKTTKPDGKTAYYGLNRKSTYPISIFEDELKRAFTSENEFMSLYNRIVTSMLSGDQIDEFLLTKGVIAKTIDEGAIQIIESDLSNPKAIAKSISNISKNFVFPSTTYAPYNKVNSSAIASGEKGCVTFCDPSSQVILMRADVETEINFEVLATMFNMQLAEIKAMTILVDNFPSENYDVYAVLCDKETIQIRDTVFKTESLYNGSNLVYNLWLHHWQFLFVSMFGNIVAFAKEKEAVDIPVTKITLSGNNTVTVSGTSQLSYTFTPSTATNRELNWTSSDNEKATVNQDGLVTGVATGTVTITATNPKSGVKGTFNITVS